MPEYIDRKKIHYTWWEKQDGTFTDGVTLQSVINNMPIADVVEVKHGRWETVHGVLTPGGDPLKRCPYCKSRESEHLDGVEHPSRWMFCPICGAKMDLEEGAN